MTQAPGERCGFTRSRFSNSDLRRSEGWAKGAVPSSIFARRGASAEVDGFLWLLGRLGGIAAIFHMKRLGSFRERKRFCSAYIALAPLYRLAEAASALCVA